MVLVARTVQRKIMNNKHKACKIICELQGPSQSPHLEALTRFMLVNPGNLMPRKACAGVFLGSGGCLHAL